MMSLVFSEDIPPIDWHETKRYSDLYGNKGATSLAIPRLWTPPFVLIPAYLSELKEQDQFPFNLFSKSDWKRILALSFETGVIVRSSVVNETIWDRGTYTSIPIAWTTDEKEMTKNISDATKCVITSANGRSCGIMIQKYILPVSQGEFGNLLRISKTRDHWELSQCDSKNFIIKNRLNCQRDQAASPTNALIPKAGLPQERLFGSIGAWLNNELLLGHLTRLNCEWITDNKKFYLVQIDEEDEDVSGINPFQVRIAPAHNPQEISGHFLNKADLSAIKTWDKLKVLEDLWEVDERHKPTLFYLAISDLPVIPSEDDIEALKNDLLNLLGSNEIIVRTSVKAGAEKLTNLPRTDGLSPKSAANWCIDQAAKLRLMHSGEMAFIFHRFVAARSSAWVRADPDNPTVEIHATWGLPDALQFCPYDIWEVHTPTNVATGYPEYKSDILIPNSQGNWSYARVKNELARNNCMSTLDAKNLAKRFMDIAVRLGRACHIMWFVGCVDSKGELFNIPWYWTNAHETIANSDRSNYETFVVTDRESLAKFNSFTNTRHRQALALKPSDLSLMRDNNFLDEIALAANSSNVPIILTGSSLAHAFYQLRKQGCTIISPNEKEYTRSRRKTNSGKLVRDLIPTKILERQEESISIKIPDNLKRAYLVTKLIEEAIEVREAANLEEKIEELADLFEVLRAIANTDGIDMGTINRTADRKKEKVGGFDKGQILLQTEIRTTKRNQNLSWQKQLGDVILNRTSENSADIPFSFFGFMEVGRTRSMLFEQLDIRLDLELKKDRIEVRLYQGSSQIELPFYS